MNWKRCLLALVAVAALLGAAALVGRAHAHEGISTRTCQVCQVAKAPMLDFAPEAALERPVFSCWQAHSSEAQPSAAVPRTHASRAPPA